MTLFVLSCQVDFHVSFYDSLSLRCATPRKWCGERVCSYLFLHKTMTAVQNFLTLNIF